ncbi:MAG: HlyD family efflux transporter periplasmic adaptor subunit [Alphaproteobacteria bacterium]|nr:HlyD family efflux transporter periplasmic adaptor subunit [Alphaproteobacteria bacterium]
MNFRKLSALALASCLVVATAAAQADDTDNSSALVKLSDMKQGSLPTYVTAFGQVEPAATAREGITAPFGARVQTVDVQTGQEVTKGTPLVTVVPGPDTKAAYKLAKDTYTRTAQLAKAHLATANDLAKAESDLSVLEEEGASGPLTIKAPYDAIVLKVDAAQGAIVSHGDSLLEIAKPDGLVVKVGVDPGVALTVKPGQDVTLTPFSQSGTPVQGKVAVRSAVINSDTGLVPTEITFPPGKLLVGEMIRASIKNGEQAGFVVPHAAILVDDDGTIFVVQADNMTAKKVAVDILASDGKQDVISGDDLDPKLQVVTEGAKQLDDGTKLRVANAGGASGK